MHRPCGRTKGARARKLSRFGWRLHTRNEPNETLVATGIRNDARTESNNFAGQRGKGLRSSVYREIVNSTAGSVTSRLCTVLRASLRTFYRSVVSLEFCILLFIEASFNAAFNRLTADIVHRSLVNSRLHWSFQFLKR